MAHHKGVEEKVERLRAICESGAPAEIKAELVKALASPSNILAAKAAALITERGDAHYTAHLIKAFERFMQNPTKNDRGCLAKERIAECLLACGGGEAELFLAGLAHVQHEPVYGGHVDVAGRLRGICAMALAGLEYPRARFFLAPLLLDPEPEARAGAIRALEYFNDETSELLLQMKALSGDKVISVMEECLAALLRMAPDTSFDFVAGFLDVSDVSVAERAALVIGESRREGAFEVLRGRWDGRAEHDFRCALLIAMGLTRSPEAFEFLLRVVREENAGLARSAVNSLTIYAHDERFRVRIDETLRLHGTAALRAEFGMRISD